MLTLMIGFFGTLQLPQRFSQTTMLSARATTTRLNGWLCQCSPGAWPIGLYRTPNRDSKFSAKLWMLSFRVNKTLDYVSSVLKRPTVINRIKST
ncbi:hypothetical protein L208DRAFT_480308 [Tricholoma matsutake]|nr:hypothetical protein L208DRAFT_480308 [Tricholoma matsutake 945]